MGGNMKIYKVTDPEFKPYGRVVDNVDFTQLLEALAKTPVPAGVDYFPSVAELEATDAFETLSTVAYGEMPIQIGYCNGHNTMLNALEYHRDSEINVAANGAVLMLGLLSEVEDDHTYDTSKVKAFYLPAGMAVEVYATTLHYAPCTAEGQDGFQVAIVLPKGTNYPLKSAHAKVADVACCGGVKNEDSMLTAVNKWLIGHAEGGLDEGSFLGLKGKNLCLTEDFE
jgi:hypothetical protein